MCGIVGYVGKQNAVPVLVQGLEHLEYRGYDSAGIACFSATQKDILIVKEKGKLECLKEKLKSLNLTSSIGIGHTRWATHGEPSQANAHPHKDSKNQIALVHNGIIENYDSLKAELRQKGYRFSSQTDTEVAANLIGSFYKKGNLLAAVQQSIKKLHGFFALVVIAKEEPDKLIVFKRSNPLVIGLGKNENFIASDIAALLPYTHEVLFLEDEEYAIITADSVQIFSVKNQKPVKRSPTHIQWNISEARKGGYPHFMLKEIHEQPRVLEEVITKRMNPKGQIYFDTLSKGFENKLKAFKRIFLVSCGTAYHAGLVGSRMIEDLCRIPTKVQVSSEFRYGNPVIDGNDLVVLITQSGETADTLAALREAKSKGATTLAIVNVVGSTISREADAVIYTHAGPEIGVASTKAYTAQLMTLAFFALHLSLLRKVVSPKMLKNLVLEIKRLPSSAAILLKDSKLFEACAKKHFRCGNFLYLGRGFNFPTALEGALKLKEISYAHAHGYAAGEMKHGPIALIDENQPVICIAPSSKTYEKMISNIEEIRARRGVVISIGTAKDKTLKKLSEDFFSIPDTPEVFSPILSVIPLQIFAYYVAVFNGRDVDQPRNLAKSVTVE
jgi:glutamine---fructose-6-phosphate transaminase (isomerizing)